MNFQQFQQSRREFVAQKALKKSEFDGLWCYIGGYLDCNDDVAKKIAVKCIENGITTWQELTELDGSERQSLLFSA